MNEETKGPEAPTSEGPQLREISKEKLAQILEAHRKWVESEGKEGKRLDLSHANLQEANLRNANLQGAQVFHANLQEANLSHANLQEADLFRTNLQGAVLHGANLQGANLIGANLRGAYLVGANLQGAWLSGANLQGTRLDEANLQGANLFDSDLSGANLKKSNLQKAELSGVKGLAEAKLQNVNLEGATGLLGTEFARADVTGANLPDGIREFKMLEAVAETSKNARKIFLAMLLGCVYSLLTIATTTDARLLTNSASSPLPIIRTEIPIAWFYWAAPFALLGLYVYLHFYLGMLWEGLAGLPAKFPDGKRLDERAYPWLLNGLVRRHFARLKEGRPFLVRFKEWTTIFLALWAVPATLFWFWLRYLRRHEWEGTGWHIALIVAAVALGIMFYRSAAQTLGGTKPPPFGWKTLWWNRRIFQVAGTALILLGLSFGAIKGFRGDPDGAGSDSAEQFAKHRVVQAFEKLGYSPFANLDGTELSTKPANWTGSGDEDELTAQIGQVKKARLSGMNLRYASADGAFLVKADLDGADLRMATLTGANLLGANLRGANLGGANLQGADLYDTNFQGADLQRANLQGTDLFGANLQDANLAHANLTAAELEEADLRQATLSFANFQEANLAHANFQDANLAHAKLRGADLLGANLEGANFTGAKLQGADLVESEGLTQEQLKFACGDSETKLPRHISIALCPEQQEEQEN